MYEFTQNRLTVTNPVPWSNSNRRCSNRSSCDVVGRFLPWRSTEGELFFLVPRVWVAGSFFHCSFGWLCISSMQQLTRNLESFFNRLGWCNAMCACIYIIHRRWRAKLGRESNSLPPWNGMVGRFGFLPGWVVNLKIEINRLSESFVEYRATPWGISLAVLWEPLRPTN